jgi:hypothetical protein
MKKICKCSSFEREEVILIRYFPFSLLYKIKQLVIKTQKEEESLHAIMDGLQGGLGGCSMLLARTCTQKSIFKVQIVPPHSLN